MAPSKGPGIATLQVGPEFAQARSVGLPVGIDVHGRDPEAVSEQEPAVPAGPGGHIEGRAAGWRQRQKAQYPGGGFLRAVQSCAIYECSKDINLRRA